MSIVQLPVFYKVEAIKPKHRVPSEYIMIELINFEIQDKDVTLEHGLSVQNDNKLTYKYFYDTDNKDTYLSCENIDTIAEWIKKLQDAYHKSDIDIKKYFNGLNLLQERITSPDHHIYDTNRLMTTDTPVREITSTDRLTAISKMQNILNTCLVHDKIIFKSSNGPGFYIDWTLNKNNKHNFSFVDNYTIQPTFYRERYTAGQVFPLIDTLQNSNKIKMRKPEFFNSSVTEEMAAMLSKFPLFEKSVSKLSNETLAQIINIRNKIEIMKDSHEDMVEDIINDLEQITDIDISDYITQVKGEYGNLIKIDEILQKRQEECNTTTCKM